jgi:hypothetical protein
MDGRLKNEVNELNSCSPNEDFWGLNARPRHTTALMPMIGLVNS